ncbi:glycosyltransferase [bacterium]|nr:glycosyltransferase [bacterium]
MEKDKRNPLVSVIITAFNAAPFIEEAVISIMGQSYKNLEILIVDDGSTDNTWQILKKLAKRDKRIKLIRLEKNLGPSLASNEAIKQAQGEFIARMDADDVAFADRIEKQVRFLQNHPQVIAVGGQCQLIDEKGEIIGTKEFPLTNKKIYESLFMFNPIQHPTIMINRKLLPNGLIFYQNGSVLAHDYELIFQLAQYGRLANLKDYVLFYRQHRNSLSLRDPKKTFKHTLQVRYKAVREYGYKPSLKGLAANLAQIVIIALLPSKLIYPLFRLLRVRRKKATLPSPAPQPVAV